MTIDLAAVRAALPDYELHGELGRGSFGIVLAASHQRLQRRVAIKNLSSVFADNPVVRDRFTREARALATFDHPHLVRVYDFVERDGLCLLIMEHLAGGTLADRHEAGTLSAADACAAIAAACAGVGHAQAKGILHRDLKPENLMFGDDDQLKVVDFGLARAVGGDQTLMTAAGQVLGSPGFLAPEQVTGEPLTAAADVYALATCLYLLLSGQLPFRMDTPMAAILLARVDEVATPIRERVDLPAPLADVVMAGLARRAADRPAGATAFGEAIVRGATAAFGPGWLLDSSVPVFATGALGDEVLAARRASPTSTVVLSAAAPVPPASAHLAPPLTRRLSDEELRALLPIPESLARDARDRSEVTTEPQDPSVVRLAVREPGRAPRVVALDRTAVFGRRGAAVVLEDAEVSRRHFEIEIDGDGVTITDLGSTNGTSVNGRAAEPGRELAVGDRIEAGLTAIEVTGVEPAGGTGTTVLPGPPPPP